jgi:hypothetical protein
MGPKCNFKTWAQKFPKNLDEDKVKEDKLVLKD